MFTAYRTVLRYGREEDPTDTTQKQYATADQAIAYVKRYAKGIRFVNAAVEDESGRLIFEIVDYGSKTNDLR
jgi:hypothetical protein